MSLQIIPSENRRVESTATRRTKLTRLGLAFAGESTGTERCLSYDEKPLLLFQRLKDSGQSPVFMLRHIVSRVSYSPPFLLLEPSNSSTFPTFFTLPFLRET